MQTLNADTWRSHVHLDSGLLSAFHNSISGFVTAPPLKYAWACAACMCLPRRGAEELREAFEAA